MSNTYNLRMEISMRRSIPKSGMGAKGPIPPGGPGGMLWHQYTLASHSKLRA